ncbi:CAMK family protein kinase [Trichomonas vaginalis G3]|uniref:CAMK family protein kinase n=1 Tax=Trichomonas vaginalis (strain ATCC PRA-98 / G3) TaxID=412133 RepID=A2EEC4_TRIV3|nr:protein serine/threonine kinase protein [Trichomonas vaginalis G3]EAY09022.1 CAMK family protein kinase [Trichomonas vaginalis G3]KAI5496270.1 protein serine/threonine kinase protein [Trichomonas vaginalis G3]|eukprot:XP_001321245.1 CAMK family protein kinase [Trichomonas vaginalis G3]
MNFTELNFLQENDYSYTNIISQTSNCEIMKVYSTKYQTFFAMKKILKKNYNNKELEILKSVHHSSIIYLYDFLEFDDYIYMVYEYCPKSVNDIIASKEHLSHSQLQHLIFQILTSLKVLHDYSISHGDFKPANILLDANGRVKLSNFDLSTILNEKCPISNNYRGTLLFMAPEIFNKSGYDPIKADIWALGVTLFALVTKEYPFYAEDQMSLMQLVSKGVFAKYRILDDNLRKLISKCLELNPQSRPTIDDLLNSPYFDTYIPPNYQKRSRSRISTAQASLILKPSLSNYYISLPRAAQLPIRRRQSK